MKQRKIPNSSGNVTCPRKSKVKASQNIHSEVLINVGLFESNDEGDIFSNTDSRVPVKVGKQYTAEEVLKTALKNIQIMSNLSAPWTIMFKKLLNLFMFLLKVLLYGNSGKNSNQNLRWIYFCVTLVYMSTAAI